MNKISTGAKILVLVLAAAVIVTAVSLVFYNGSNSQTPGNIDNFLSVYKNDQYGFQLQYPKDLLPQVTFQQYYHLSNQWRAELATDQPKGQPIVSIVTYNVTNTNSYPRYFDSELRVGASSDPEDVKNCLLNSPGYTDWPVQDVTINGVVFKKFVIQNAGMMQYLDGISYRTVHNVICFAVEQLKTGSNYRDDPASAKDIPDAVLNAAYDRLDGIVQTFKFLK